MENQSNSRTTKSDIGGTVYVVESRVSDSAKESAYSKLKRLITVNAKSLSKLPLIQQMNSPSIPTAFWHWLKSTQKLQNWMQRLSESSLTKL